MRSFIAIEVKEAIKNSLTQIQQMGLVKGEGIRWVKPDRMHLTLKFLGEIDPSTVPHVTKAIQVASEDMEPFIINFETLGFFPDLKRARVMWTGIRDDRKNLEILFRRLELELLNLGFDKELRAFRPHLTLARFKGRVKILQAFEKMESKDFGSQAVKEIVLFKSDLKPQGPIYSPLSTATLKE